MKKIKISKWAASLLCALVAFGSMAGFVAPAKADTVVRLVSSKDVPIQTAAIVAGGFSIGRGDVQTDIAYANHQLGFGPGNLPNNYNFAASGNNLNQIVDFNHAYGKENVYETIQDGNSMGTVTVQHVVAPLRANRFDSTVSGIFYCTRELKSGVVIYRIVVRFQNKPDYINEYGVMDDGGFYEMTHKHWDTSFDNIMTVLKKQNDPVYQQTKANIAGTQSLFAQSRVVIAGTQNYVQLQNARLVGDSKKLSDRLQNFWSSIQAIIAAVTKIYTALKAFWPVIKTIICFFFHWFC